MNAAGRVAILGGVRIPFARQNTNYAAASNLDMLTATLKGVVERFVLEGRRLGEVAAGAVLKHTRDFNLTRDASLASGLAPETPAYDVQQACATSLESAILVGNKIAMDQIEVGIAGGVDSASDTPVAITRVFISEPLNTVGYPVPRKADTPGADRRKPALVALQELTIKNSAANLKKQVGAALSPTHVLPLAESSSD